jgi:hypothetical protein
VSARGHMARPRRGNDQRIDVPSIEESVGRGATRKYMAEITYSVFLLICAI